MDTHQIPLQPVDSSQIAAQGYDSPSKTLVLQFKAKGGVGSKYSYAGVDETTYSEFLAADSQGSFFIKRIKPHFSHTKL